MTDLVARVGGRLLVLDPDGRLLLLHERVGDGDHWLTPGGGVEPGEHPRDAALREAREEIGLELELAADAGEVLRTRRQWTWRETTYDQVDHFYVVRVGPRARPEPANLTAVEREVYLGNRWWTLAELRKTAEMLVPPDLADVLERVLGEFAADR